MLSNISLTLLLLLFHISCINNENNPLVKDTTNIWIDIDPGYGDGVALFIASFSSYFKLKGVTVTYGNTSRPNGLRNTKIFLSQFSKIDIPIFRGAEFGLNQYKYILTDDFHGTEGIPYSQLKDYEKQNLPQEKGKTQHDIYKAIMLLTDKITYIVLGPNTTQALLLKTFPEILSKIERIVIMGGGIKSGNVTKWAEFNIYQDPESFNIILNSGIEAIIFPLDGLDSLTYDQNEIDLIRSHNTKNNNVIYTISELFQACYDTSEHHKFKPNLYDHGVFPVLFSQYYCEMNDMSFEIILDGEKRGQTIFTAATNSDNAKPIVKVCMNADKNIFREFFFKLLEETKDIAPHENHANFETVLLTCGVFWIGICSLFFAIYQIMKFNNLGGNFSRNYQHRYRSRSLELPNDDSTEIRQDVGPKIRIGGHSDEKNTMNSACDTQNNN